MKKVEKKQWFVIGLQIIENNGVAKITIDNLCNLLEITKGVAQVDKLRLDYLTKLIQDCGYDVEFAHKIATIQYSLLIGLQHICPEIPACDFNELQNMLIEKFETK